MNGIPVPFETTMTPVDNSINMPTVAIFMVTYNHEKYIAQSIESVVNQKTNFRFKLVIGEDCSKDNNRAICFSYTEKYPGIVEVIANEKNNIKKNIDNVWKSVLATGAKYVAVCEGDDYWTDTGKLQKQYDFLEANPGYSVCFTHVDIIDEMGLNRPEEQYLPYIEREDFTIEDFILCEMSIIPTATLFFRNIFSYPMPGLYSNAVSGDIALHLLLADKGKVKRLPEKMAVYRNHTGGITKTKEVRERAYDALMLLYHQFNEYTDFRYDCLLKKRFLAQAKWGLIYGAKDKKGLNKLKHYFQRMPEYIRYSDKIDFKELVYYHTILFFPFLLKLFRKQSE